MHVPMSVVECLLRVYHYHTSIYRLEGKLRVRSFISLLEKNGGFQKMTWEFLWKTFFDFMTSIGRSGVASKRFLYEWHMRNNSNWFLGRRSFVTQTPFFCNDCYLPDYNSWNKDRRLSTNCPRPAGTTTSWRRRIEFVSRSVGQTTSHLRRRFYDLDPTSWGRLISDIVSTTSLRRRHNVWSTTLIKIF